MFKIITLMMLSTTEAKRFYPHTQIKAYLIIPGRDLKPNVHRTQHTNDIYVLDIQNDKYKPLQNINIESKERNNFDIVKSNQNIKNGDKGNLEKEYPDNKNLKNNCLEKNKEDNNQQKNEHTSSLNNKKPKDNSSQGENHWNEYIILILGAIFFIILLTCGTYYKRYQKKKNEEREKEERRNFLKKIKERGGYPVMVVKNENTGDYEIVRSSN